MPNINDLVTASTYNSIRSKIYKVLGPGDGAETGYGQQMASSLKADNDLITSQDMQNLYDDLLLAGKHQTGDPVQWTVPTAGLNAPSTGEIIGVFASDVGTSGTTIDATTDLNEGFLDFEQAAAQIDTNYLSVGPGALTTTIAKESIRSAVWKNTINHTVTISWDTYDVRRTWGNAGGKIRFDANLTGGTSQPGDETNTPPGTKDEIWQTMLNTMGTIDFGINGVTTTGTGTVNSNVSIIYSDKINKVDWSDTSSSNPIELFTKSGSGVYSENRYRIFAWQVATNSMRFNIVLEDNDLGDDQNPGDSSSVPVDENVTGTVTSTVSLLNPNGFLDFDIPSSVTDSNL